MKLKFELLEQDYIDFNLFCQKNLSTFKRNYQFLRLVVSTCIILVSAYYWNQASSSRGIILTIALVMFIGFNINYSKMMASANEKHVRGILEEGGASTILGEMELHISEDGITQTTETRQIKSKTIERLEETEQYIFAFNTPVSAFIIPKRLFNNAKERNQVLSLLYALKSN